MLPKDVRDMLIGMDTAYCWPLTLAHSWCGEFRAEWPVTRREIFTALGFADTGDHTEAEIMKYRMDQVRALEAFQGTSENAREEIATWLNLHYSDDWELIIEELKERIKCS
jgi:hypothetical protein